MNTKMNGYGNNGIEKANSKEPAENGIAALTNGGLPSKDPVDKIVVPKKKLVRRKKRREEEPDELAKLGKIKDQQKLDERIKLAVQKLQLCQRVHNFHDPEAQLSSKESKRAALEELLDFLKGQKGAISEKFYGEVFTTVSVNLFRDLPPREDELRPADFELAQQSGGTAGEEETEFGNCEDPAWLHLEPIYELFLQFLGSLEFRATLAKKFIDQQFVLRLLALLQSEDPRERQSLAKILKRIYAKFIRLRPFIRKQTSYLLLTFLTERMPVWGTGELLDILQSVVDDFRVPLKAENKQLLLKVILPLHKPSKCFGQYHSKLADRVVQFIKLDASLTEPAIRTMLKCWPKQNCTKELHFLEELQKILAHTELEEFRKIVDPLFRRISLCICGSHCQVANRALQLWKEEGKISKLLEACNSEIMEKVCAALLQASSQHWNKNVRTLALDVQNALAERNWKLWNKLVAEAKEEVQRQQQQQQQMQNGNPEGVEEEDDENDEKQEVEADDEVKVKKEANNHVHEDGTVGDEEEEWTWTWTYEDEEEEEAGEDEEEWEYEYVDEEEPEENGTS